MGGKIVPSVELINELLECNFESGKIYWKPRTPSLFKGDEVSAEGQSKSWNARYGGKEAFTAQNKGGYKVGSINDNILRAHRVIWAMHKGCWDFDMIDHVNGLRSDNRIVNLREADNQRNQWNRKKSCGLSSAYKGVSWDKARSLWSAKISKDGKTLNLGRFSSEADAASAYRLASNGIHGEFKRHY